MSEWVVQTYTNEINMSSVTYGNGLFVAVAYSGTGNRVMTSLDGITWTQQTTPANNNWYGVTYGNGLFVAVAYSGTGNRVMTSLDGITWTQQTTPANNNWYGVTYGNGLFVAVAGSGTGNRVMTSPDGITWTSRTSAADNSWYGVTYGNGLFVAVAGSGTGNRVMTSLDGITWTSRTSAADNSWYGVTYGNGLFVAVAGSGTGNRVMTSPDGITWTSRTSAADNNWYGVTYGNGLFVAVAGSGQKNRVMTSPDGITWTSRTSAADNNWYGVTYGNGLFVAVAFSGTGNRVMTSPDGITWTQQTTPADNNWYGVTYGNGLFVAVAGSGTGNRVMTSNGKLLPTLGSFTIPTKTFGDAAFTLTAPSSNSDGGFTYSSSNTSIASISGTQVTMLDSGSVTITATQAATSNYLSGTTTATLTISKATPTLGSFTISARTYSPNAFTLTAPSSNSDGGFTYSSSNTSIASISGTQVTMLDSGSVTITATQAATSNYLSGTTTATLTISKATPTLGSFTISARTYSPNAFTLTAPSSNSDGGFTYSSSNTSIASISGTQVTMLDSGSVTITATQAATSNYLSGTTTATLTISKATPTITNFTIPRKIYGSAPFTLPTPSSNSTGLFSYESSDQTIATIAGDSLTILKFGSVIITATQAETSKYLSGTISFVFNISNICFPAGTPIVTDQGLIHIEKINPDIHTIRNKKIVGITKIYSIDKYLVCFEKDALGQNIPNQKTIITKNHRILYKGKMIQAKEFIDKFDNVYKIKYKGEMLYNVLMEKHDKMIVNNLICETLHPENSIAKLYMILKKLVDEKENKIINTENDSSVKNKIHNCRK